jgi:serine/threonine protein kinase
MSEAADFDRLESAFAEIAALEPPARAAAIERIFADRPDLRAEMTGLLASHDSLRPTEPPDELDSGAARHVGTCIGAYRLTARIGEGGMGEVYRAERADGLYTQAVAVKLTNSTIGHSESRRRFHQERQILASLRHEHIVRLLDGGTIATGQAFLIMEYVEGVPITVYCNDRSIPLDARLRLFATVCDAVQYAHQNGIVHRDLKPANVLIDGGGVAKVVDFGIAKLLADDDTRGFTSTGMPGPMTVGYASPEQLRGETVTTVSDVYSLGMILYELVTGVRPYETQGQTLERVLEIVGHERPRPPSGVVAAAAPPLPYPRTRLRGDLDAIALKAISKEAADRYASARELAADLERHLNGDPIVARPPSTGYVLRRLARRHVRFVGAAAVALVAVFAASGIALWQWGVARRAQARAEQRFNDVRQLANALIFKVHDAVLPLAGSTPVRRTIVDEALKYLERLEAESGDDLALRLELSAAYRQLGGILGDASRPNLGDRQGARQQYERARELLLPVPADAPFERVAALVDVATSLAPLYRQANEPERAAAMTREASEYASRYAEQHPNEPRAIKLAGRVDFFRALAAPPREAIPIWEQTLASYERVLTIEPDDPSNQRNVALVGKYLGGIFEVANRPDDARRLYQRSLELDEKRLAAAPDNQQAQFDAAISFSNIASVAETLGDVPAAAGYFDRSLALRRQLAASDPANMQAASRLGFLLNRMARFHRERDRATALGLARESIQILQRVFDTTRDAPARLELAFAWHELGEVERRGGGHDAACRAFRAAADLYSRGDKLTGRHIPQSEAAAREAASCGA